MKYAELVGIISNLKKISDIIDNDGEIENHPVLMSISNDKVMNTVASALVTSSAIFKIAISNIEEMVESCASEFDEQDIDAISMLASEFDSSGDEFLQKQASVLDQILLNFAGHKALLADKKAAEEEVDKLRREYREKARDAAYSKTRETLEKDIKAADSIKAIKEQVKTFRPLEHALSTRHCPEHPGTGVIRIGENIYQCEMDKRIYNYQEGYKTMKGNEIPGSDVSEQTRSLGDRVLEQMSFSTRETRLNNG